MSEKLIQLQQYPLVTPTPPTENDYMLTLLKSDGWSITNENSTAKPRNYFTESKYSTNVANLLTHLSLYSRYIFEPVDDQGLVCNTWEVEQETDGGDFMNIQPNNGTSRLLELRIENDNDNTDNILIWTKNSNKLANLMQDNKSGFKWACSEKSKNMNVNIWQSTAVSFEDQLNKTKSFNDLKGNAGSSALPSPPPDVKTNSSNYFLGIDSNGNPTWKRFI